MSMPTVGLLGKDGGALKELVDRAIVVENDTTARIQETHIFVLHYWAGLIERGLIADGGSRESAS
jgi:D-sedoheptulose 7-phosphate isomerase